MFNHNLKFTFRLLKKYRSIYFLNILTFGLTTTVSCWLFVLGFQEGENIPNIDQIRFIIGGISLLVLTISAIGFANFSLLNFNNRLKELGIRKAIGSGNATLIHQYLLEVLIQLTLAVILGIIILRFTNDHFNEITGLKITFLTRERLWSFRVILIPSVTVTIVMSLLARATIRKINPILALHKRFTYWVTSKTFSTIVVTLEFALSFILLSSTLAIHGQIQTIKLAQTILINQQQVYQTFETNPVAKYSLPTVTKTNFLSDGLISIKSRFVSTNEKYSAALELSQGANQITLAQLESHLERGMGILSSLALCVIVFAFAKLINNSLKSRAVEVAVRRVLGANFKQIWRLIITLFIKIILIATAIAIPLVYLFVQKWQKEFEDEICLSSLDFILPFSLILILLAFVSGFHVYNRVVVHGPLDSLRNE